MLTGTKPAKIDFDVVESMLRDTVKSTGLVRGPHAKPAHPLLDTKMLAIRVRGAP
jgi:hypothetical protein